VAGFSFQRLVEAFIVEIERGGATVLIVGQASRRPARLRVITPDGSSDCAVFLWTITPGGGGAGVRPAGERRIQLTNVASFPLTPGVRTVVGGWSDEFGAFAFWDPRRHSQFSPRSPSLQVNAPTLEEAGARGLATYTRPSRQGREVVVAVAPSDLLWYVQNGHLLHNADEDADCVRDLLDATPDQERSLIDGSASEPQAARRYEIVETVRAYRDARFRAAVLRAYTYRCAVCDVALKLVDAAHIIPVAHPRSTDEVTNGIALCRLHHGAYDNSLLGVQSTYRVVINGEALSRLQDAGLGNGFEDFRSRLPEKIRLPGSPEVRPEPRTFLIGLEARQWPAALIA
jgi:putative restriction endonuclease